MHLFSHVLYLSCFRVASARSTTRHHVAASSFISSFMGNSGTRFSWKATSYYRPASVTTAAALTGGTTKLASSQLPYEEHAVSISDAYDSGNSEFVSAEVLKDDDECDVRVNVRIKKDP